jgi:hypothetical protein
VPKSQEAVRNGQRDWLKQEVYPTDRLRVTSVTLQSIPYTSVKKRVLIVIIIKSAPRDGYPDSSPTCKAAVVGRENKSLGTKINQVNGKQRITSGGRLQAWRKGSTTRKQLQNQTQ